MKKLTGVLAGLIAFFAAAGVATPAMAQEKMAAQKMEKAHPPTVKEVGKNDTFKVLEVTFKPGDEAPSAERPARVERALTNGTIELIYPDGKKVKRDIKVGRVVVLDKTPAYAVKNIGKTTVRLYIVMSTAK